MQYLVDDRDLAAFLVYASRELSLDSSLRGAAGAPHFEEHRQSVAALRELNCKMLFKETRRLRP